MYLSGEEVEVELVGLFGLERMEAQSLPPGAGAGVERSHDDRAAGCLLVELDGGGEHVRDQGGADAEVGIAAVNGEAAQQQCGNGIGCAFRDGVGGGGAVDPGHRDAGVCHDDLVGVRDEPGGRRVAAAVLAGIAAKPFVQYGLTAVELASLEAAPVEQRRAPKLSQAS